MKKTAKEQGTPGKELSLSIARLFPECFSVFGDRIAVRNDAGTEATRTMVRANLEALEEKRENKKKSETV